ncbi:hypothetical protein [uncultured Pseudoflavonifractor sp.]|nr:hypothetical protein [uncultured Pseudoflavonifractor sp.]
MKIAAVTCWFESGYAGCVSADVALLPADFYLFSQNQGISGLHSAVQ